MGSSNQLELCLSDLAKALGIPVMMVVGMKLGCLNHAILTDNAMNQKGINSLGWVANVMDSEFSHIGENIKSLIKKIKLPYLGKMPYLQSPTAWLNLEWSEKELVNSVQEEILRSLSI